MPYVIAHISDIHFGSMNAERLYDELNNVFLKSLIKLPKLDMVFIAGDLFHKDLSLESKSSEMCFKFISSLIYICKIKNAKLRIIKGTKSHDKNQLRNLLSYGYIDKSIDFTLIESSSFEFIYPDFKVLYLPEEYVENQDEYYEELFNHNDYDLIVGHGMFKQVAFKEQDSEIQMKNAPIYSVKKLNKICKGPILFGHIHTMTIIKNSVFYSGSFSRWIFGEEKPKGFNLFIINPDKEKFIYSFIENTMARKFITLNIKRNLLKNINIEKYIKSLEEFKSENNIDKLRLKIIDTGEDEISLKIKFLKEYYSHSKDVKLEIKIIDKKLLQDEKQKEILDKYDFIFDSSLSVENKLSRYIEEKFEYKLTDEKIKNIIFSDKNEILNKLLEDNDVI